MKTILIFYKDSYIEDLQVHHLWTDDKIEEVVEKWCAENSYDSDFITWSFLHDGKNG